MTIDAGKSDWLDACDPVPARRELTDAEKKRLKALFEYRRNTGMNRTNAGAPSAYRVDRDFDDMGA